MTAMSHLFFSLYYKKYYVVDVVSGSTFLITINQARVMEAVEANVTKGGDASSSVPNGQITEEVGSYGLSLEECYVL